MEFSPDVLFRLSLEALIWGLILGIISCFTDAIRCMLMKMEDHTPRFKKLRALPFLGRAFPKQPRRGCPKVLSRLLVFLLDVGLCVTAAIGLVLLSWIGCEGRIRMVFVLMMLCGFFLLKRLLHRPIRILFGIVTGLLYLILIYARFLLLLPFRLVGCALLRALRCLHRKVGGRITEARESSFRKRETIRILDRAKNGFSCIPSVFSGFEAEGSQKSITATQKQS